MCIIVHAHLYCNLSVKPLGTGKKGTFVLIAFKISITRSTYSSFASESKKIETALELTFVLPWIGRGCVKIGPHHMKHLLLSFGYSVC